MRTPVIINFGQNTTVHNANPTEHCVRVGFELHTMSVNSCEGWDWLLKTVNTEAKLAYHRVVIYLRTSLIVMLNGTMN